MVNNSSSRIVVKHSRGEIRIERLRGLVRISSYLFLAPKNIPVLHGFVDVPQEAMPGAVVGMAEMEEVEGS